MRKATPLWKVVLAAFSLLLTILIWVQGLQESFSRPSVMPKLSLRQHEIVLLAEPSVSPALRPFLVGEDPQASFKEVLEEIPLDQLKDRERLLLAALEPNLSKRKELLEIPAKDQALLTIQEKLIKAPSTGREEVLNELNNSNSVINDPTLYKIYCNKLIGNDPICVNKVISRRMSIKLHFSQLFPVFSVLLGIILLLRQLWLIVKKQVHIWQPIVSLPLDLIDMTLLVAGGFVVLGEVISPAIFVSLSDYFLEENSGPLNVSLRVFIGYIAMALPSLILLSRQISGIKEISAPKGGWLQFGFRPIPKAVASASSGWLMVLPVVLFVSWLMNNFIGDQGGSNPLLEMVLSSQSPKEWILLLLTTVIFAPVFEELIFRGALLPVLANNIGRNGGLVVSALVFAIAHLSVGELIPLFVLGLGLATLRLSTGRLFPCMLMHSIWNGVTFGNLLLLGN